LIAAMSEQELDGGTPTSPSLTGALSYAKQRAARKSGRRIAVVYTTDGDPTGCEPKNTVDNAIAAAKEAYESEPSVPTYVIGVGSNLDSLNGIAKAGGTRKAFLVDNGKDVAKKFAAALDAIRDDALTCDYGIPQPPDALDYGRVNVTVTVGENGAPELLEQAPSEADCAGEPGWFYDEPAAPTLIRLCPATCSAVLAAPGSNLEVLIGCGTVEKPIR
jgi:hypothetical protein